MIGYEPGEFGGTMEAWQRLIHPEDLPRVNAAIQRYLTGESPVYEIEHRIKHKQGHWLWVLNRGKIAAHTLEGQPSRITGTIADITARKKVEEALRFFQSLADAAPDAIVLATLDGHLSYANPTFRTLLGYGDDIVGMEVDRFYLQSAANAKELETLVARTGRWQGVIAHQRKDGSTFEGQVSAFLIHDSENQPLAFASIMRDLTAQIQANYERQQLQEQVIQAQQAALRELSTPLMPISEGIVVMPIIGSIDSARAQMVMETLLEGIAIHDADIAILDITGVKIVDTQVAGALVRTALAAQLLGTRVILSGISPEIAQTLVQIGTDLREMTSKRSMRQAIAYALELRKK